MPVMGLCDCLQAAVVDFVNAELVLEFASTDRLVFCFLIALDTL